MRSAPLISSFVLATLGACGPSSHVIEADASADAPDATQDPVRDASIDAPTTTEPACETPGVTETVPCGARGTTTRFCTVERTWAYGACIEAGECTPGEQRVASCGNCGSRTDTCGVTCMWQPALTCEGEGVCEAGTETRTNEGCAPGQTRAAQCNSSCALEPAGECAADACDSPGTVETVPCGSCGQMTRFCTVGREWTYGVCENEGECAPGTTGTAPCGACGTTAAFCSALCQWQPTGECTDQGACFPGETRTSTTGCTAGETRLLTCDDTCAFQSGACGASVCSPGQTSQETCGNCGVQDMICNAAGQWEPQGACQGQGQCAAGTSGTQTCGSCGTQTFSCDEQCGFTALGTCTGEVTCTAPAPTCLDATRLRVFTSAASCGTRTCVVGQTDVTCPSTCSAGACDRVRLVDGLGGPAGFGTSNLGLIDDGLSPPIDLTPIFPSGIALDDTVNQLWVSNNGTIYAEVASPAFYQFRSDYRQFAPWMGDVDNTDNPLPGAGVYWAFDAATHRFIATWNRVGRFRSDFATPNTFQAIITARPDVAPGDFDLEYRFSECGWWRLGNGLGAVMGWASGGVAHTHPSSETAEMLNLCTTSNVGTPGLWRWQFRGGTATF
jgi:Nidogen-like